MTPLHPIDFTPLRAAILFLAAIGGSGIGSMAGGGTLVTFSTLIFLGMPGIMANATSTVGLLPTGAATMFGHREEMRTHGRWIAALLAPGLVGGMIGSVLLIATPPRAFERLAPFLVLFATSLFVIQGLLRPSAGIEPRRASPARIAGVGSLLFGVAIYEGYFGAGSGILILALLGFLGLGDIHAMNGLKGFFVVAINVVASTYFVIRGAVHWPSALVMAAGSVVGGYSGARLSRRIGRARARRAVIVIGLVLTAALLARGRRL
ncbi:MAG TPA: sulfite exporter TauE/SafE family protein [Thermoanaerobaculia bacterium]|nr:sulfite exporter TauE/SafE family protein [Thermoanaerobaculia bacterium]